MPWRRNRLSIPGCMGFPGGSDGKESTCNSGDLGSIPGLGRSPGEGHSNSVQYFCLENPMDRGAWWATVQGLQRVRHNWSNLIHTHTVIYLTYYCKMRKWRKSIESYINWNCMYSLDIMINCTQLMPSFFFCPLLDIQLHSLGIS